MISWITDLFFIKSRGKREYKIRHTSSPATEGGIPRHFTISLMGVKFTYAPCDLVCHNDLTSCIPFYVLGGLV